MRRGGEDVEIVSTGCRPPSVPRPGRCREDVEIVSTGCRPPSVPHPWMLLLHMQETALWIPPVCCVLDDICKRQLCGFPQWGLLSSRGGGGADRLASGLQFPPFGTVWATHGVSCSVTFVVVRWAALRGKGIVPPWGDLCVLWHPSEDVDLAHRKVLCHF